MGIRTHVDPEQVLGRSPEQLSLEELRALEGYVVALEVYTPATTPLRQIAAIGEFAEDCVKRLVAKGLDPRQFEYVRLNRQH